jgi:tRNA dimethylallyltransferase
MKHITHTIPVILGPTASGKTAYAIELAKMCNGAIISADSRQVYTGMNIGTAKPQEAWAQEVHTAETPDFIDNIPHYLLNIASPNHTYTLSDWLRDAKQAINIIRKNNQTPIIVGGTMLYIDALTDGYDLPEIEPNSALREKLEAQSPETLYAELIQQDPAAAHFIQPKNTRRIIRALEVMNATGKKFSALRTASASPYEFSRIGIFSGWEQLKNNTEKRSEQMLRDGLITETKNLREKFPHSKLLNTINYKETGLLLGEKISEEEAVTLMTRATFRYAHRQMSWWNRRTDINWICL